MFLLDYMQPRLVLLQSYERLLHCRFQSILLNADDLYIYISTVFAETYFKLLIEKQKWTCSQVGFFEIVISL
jgi:hypothetical protein